MCVMHLDLTGDYCSPFYLSIRYLLRPLAVRQGGISHELQDLTVLAAIAVLSWSATASRVAQPHETVAGPSWLGYCCQLVDIALPFLPF